MLPEDRIRADKRIALVTRIDAFRNPGAFVKGS